MMGNLHSTTILIGNSQYTCDTTIHNYNQDSNSKYTCVQADDYEATICGNWFVTYVMKNV